MEGLIAGGELTQNKGLEEPAGVGEVPFDGAGLGTGLNHHVFGRERTTEMSAGLADGLEACEERADCGGGATVGDMVFSLW